MKPLYHTLLILLGWIFAANSSAQEVATWLRSMPEDLCPLLTQANKEELLTQYKEGVPSTVINRLGGNARLDTLSSDFLSLYPTASSSLEMHTVVIDDTTQVIAIISSVMTPQRDSEFRCFDRSWNPSSSLRFIAPQAIDFYNNEAAQMNITKEGVVTEEEWRNHVIPYIVGYTFSSTAPDSIICSISIEHLPQEKAERLRTVLRPSLTLPIIRNNQ